MKSIVDQLLEADREAQNILDAAQQYAKDKTGKVGGEKDRIHREFEAKITKHIKDARTVDEREAEEAEEEVRSRYARLTQEMEQTYQENKAQWPEELFQRCIDGR